MTVAWDPAHTGAGITLSVANTHTVFASGTQNSTRATRSYDCARGGKLSWKFTRTAGGGAENYPCVGYALLSDDAGTPFTGLGLVGYLLSLNGQALVDGSFSGVVLSHGGAVNSVVTTDRISTRSPIVVILDAGAGTMAIYGIDGGGAQHLAYTLTGVAGVIFPTLGFGGAGALPTEAYDVDFTYVPAWAPAGTVSYDTATTPPAPVASFTLTPASGANPLAVAFTDTSSNTPTSWLWAFGDGATSTAQSPTHTYAVSGTYNVTLTATNAGGSGALTRYGAVVVATLVLPSVVALNPAPAGTALLAASADLENSWITSSGSVVIVPGRQGGLVSVSTAGAVLHRLDGVPVAFGIASGGYVYCFDGVGGGTAVAIDGTTGSFTPYGTFAATDCEGVLDGYISGSSLIVAVRQRASVVTFSIATPGAPGAPTRAAHDGYALNNVLNDAGSTPLTDQIQDALGLPVWFPATAGASLTGPVTVIASGPDARAQVK